MGRVILWGGLAHSVKNAHLGKLKGSCGLCARVMSVLQTESMSHCCVDVAFCVL